MIFNFLLYFIMYRFNFHRSFIYAKFITAVFMEFIYTPGSRNFTAISIKQIHINLYPGQLNYSLEDLSVVFHAILHFNIQSTVRSIQTRMLRLLKLKYFVFQ